MADNVNHPRHYNSNYECIEVMKDIYGRSAVEVFCLMNAFKYLWRCDKKGKLMEDIKKANYYLEYIIQMMEEIDESDEINEADC